MPIAFEPPPTQATTRSGSRPAVASICARASSPITRCRSRTSAGNGAGPTPSRSRSACRRRWRPSRGSRRVTASLSVRAPASTGDDRRAEQLHPLHVRALAPHVLGAHVDDALEPEQRARGRGRDAVLAGAGLGDDARLAHALGEQALAERVVDLVRAGVQQVLALEVDRVPDRLRQPLGVVERRGPAGEVAQQRRQLGRGSPRRRAPAPTPPRARRAPASASRGRTGRRRGRSDARARRSRGHAPDAAAKNASTLAGSLIPGADSTPDATSTRPRPHGRDALGDVLGRQAAGQDQRHRACGAWPPAPSPTCSPVPP